MRNITTILLAVTVIMATVYDGEALQCNQVTMYLVQCLPYLRAGGNPSPACCTGLSNLKAAAPAKADRQVACNCLKNAANTIPGINDDNAKQLPSKCGVDLGVPFSKSVNCNSVN